MSAPDKIWAKDYSLEWVGDMGVWGVERIEPFDVEYTRSDLIPQWRSDMENAPRDGTIVMLHYNDWLDSKDYVTAGYWDTETSEDEATWVHAEGCGDATHWQPLPAPHQRKPE